jgi:hypothetical protein
VLLSEERDFIFGDGFFQSFPTTVLVYTEPRCIVPLTPTIAVPYASPLQYISNSSLATMRMTADEVHHLNRLVQIYARECICLMYSRARQLEICQGSTLSRRKPRTRLARPCRPPET